MIQTTEITISIMIRRSRGPVTIGRLPVVQAPTRVSTRKQTYRRAAFEISSDEIQPPLWKANVSHLNVSPSVTIVQLVTTDKNSFILTTILMKWNVTFEKIMQFSGQIEVDDSKYILLLLLHMPILMHNSLWSASRDENLILKKINFNYRKVSIL